MNLEKNNLKNWATQTKLLTNKVYWVQRTIPNWIWMTKICQLRLSWCGSGSWIFRQWYHSCPLPEHDFDTRRWEDTRMESNQRTRDCWFQLNHPKVLLFSRVDGLTAIRDQIPRNKLRTSRLVIYGFIKSCQSRLWNQQNKFSCYWSTYNQHFDSVGGGEGVGDSPPRYLHCVFKRENTEFHTNILSTTFRS